MNKRQTRSMLKQIEMLHQSTDEIYQQKYNSVDSKPQEQNKVQAVFNSQQMIQFNYVLPLQKSQIPSLQFQPSFRTKGFQTNPLMYLNHHNKIFKRNKNSQYTEESNQFLDQLVLSNGSNGGNVDTNPSTFIKRTENQHHLKHKLSLKKKSATNLSKNVYIMPSAVQIYSNDSQYNDSIVLDRLYQNESHYNFMNPMNSMNSLNSVNSMNIQQYESNQKQRTEDFQTVRPLELILKLPPFSSAQQNHEKQSKKRLSHPKNGPNFPFNLNHLINQINKDPNDEENLKMLSKNKNPHMRPFSSLVYRQIKNPQQRQFYTKCVQQSQVVNRGGLLETIQSHTLNQTQIGLKLFKNVLIKPTI